MNDRNQRNTAPRKLPPSSLGTHPEYIIHTGVPRGGASSLLGQGVAHSGTWSWRKRSVPVKSRTIDRAILHHEGIRELRLRLSRSSRDLSSNRPIPLNP